MFQRRSSQAALSFSTASGSNAIELPTGARLDLGGGASDYLVSSGTAIQTPVSLQSTGYGFQSLNRDGSTQGMSFSGSNVNIRAYPSSTVFIGDSSGTEFSVTNAKITFPATDSSGTPGAATINKASGQVAIAIGAASVTVTNSLVSTTSVVVAVLQQSDATLTQILRVVPSSGSFVITGNANATAATKVGFVVFN